MIWEDKGTPPTGCTFLPWIVAESERVNERGGRGRGQKLTGPGEEAHSCHNLPGEGNLAKPECRFGIAVLRRREQTLHLTNGCRVCSARDGRPVINNFILSLNYAR